MSVQYRIAKIDDGINSVDIDYVYKEFKSDSKFRQEHTFTCPCCGQPMMAKLGKKRTRHFAHTGKSCKREQYLHSSAEECFYEEYKRCLDEGTPFIISVWTELRCQENCRYGKNCGKRYIKQEIVLTEIFKKISPEKRVMLEGRYRRPDLLLESESGDQLWVEMWVTHTDEEKRKERSILELKIDSEDDIQRFRSHRLVQENPEDIKVRHYVTENCKAFESSPNLFMVSQKESSFVQRRSSHYEADKPEWVDLGLPSGTLWSQYIGTMTLSEAQGRFSGLIPSVEQFRELISCCRASRDHLAELVGYNDVHYELLLGDYWTDEQLPNNESVTFHRALRFIGRNSDPSDAPGSFGRSKNDIKCQLILVKRCKP